jgi:branched-chain amino acid transport system permease protein
MVFAITFAIGAGLAGFAGVVGGTALSIAPGEDTRYLLASLVVVIVGGMGSLFGALLGGILIGVSEEIASVVLQPSLKTAFSFALLIIVLLLRPQGLLGRVVR